MSSRLTSSPDVCRPSVRRIFSTFYLRKIVRLLLLDIEGRREGLKGPICYTKCHFAQRSESGAVLYRLIADLYFHNYLGIRADDEDKATASCVLAPPDGIGITCIVRTVYISPLYRVRSLREPVAWYNVTSRGGPGFSCSSEGECFGLMRIVPRSAADVAISRRGLEL